MLSWHTYSPKPAAASHTLRKATNCPGILLLLLLSNTTAVPPGRSIAPLARDGATPSRNVRTCHIRIFPFHQARRKARRTYASSGCSRRRGRRLRSGIQFRQLSHILYKVGPISDKHIVHTGCHLSRPTPSRPRQTTSKAGRRQEPATPLLFVRDCSPLAAHVKQESEGGESGRWGSSDHAQTQNPWRRLRPRYCNSARPSAWTIRNTRKNESDR